MYALAIGFLPFQPLFPNLIQVFLENVSYSEY